MARGDSIPGYAGYANNSTYIYFTPSSGDEWMITAIGAGNYDYTSWVGSFLEMTPNNGTNWYEMWSSEIGQTDVSKVIAYNDTMGRTLQLFITPTVRLRLYGGWHYYWIMGIKSKE